MATTTAKGFAPPRDASIRGALRAGGLPLLAICLLAVLLRWPTLGVQSFGDVELFTAWISRMSFGHMLSTVPKTETTPHLVYVLEWVFVRVFGDGEFGTRVLPALAGTLTVPAVYVTGALAASRRVGLAAAAFACVNPFLVWYSQEARSYPLLVFLVALSVMYLAAFERSHRTAALIGWGIAAALALATHYFAVFLIAPQVAWLFANRRRYGPHSLYAVGIPVVAGLALLPLAVHQRNSIRDPGGVLARPLIERVAAVPKNMLVGYSIPAEAFAIAISAVLVVVALVSLVRGAGGKERRGALYMAGLALAAVGVPLLLAPFSLDYVSSENLIATLVPASIVLGCGFAVTRYGRVALALLCMVSVGITIGIAAGREYQRRDWRDAAHALGAPRADRVLVVSPPFSIPGTFQIYFGSNSNFLRPGFHRVSEVDVVALAQNKSFGPGHPKPPGGPPPPAPRGFRLIGDRRTTAYRIVRYRAARPAPVRIRDLMSLVFRGAAASPILQTPRS